jgi:RNA polymerase sigma-70 factor, ECF subfamily
VRRSEPDAESLAWIGSLGADGAVRDAAVGRLHELLLRIARNEVRRRSGHLRLRGVELEDIAYQAAADAMVAIVAKLEQFRGESRFTTWAYKFVILEVSSKIGRHFWRNPPAAIPAEDWDRLPDRFGLAPGDESEWRDLLGALRHAIDETLTARQRQVFVALVLDGIPLDALVEKLDTNRNAIYKMMFDARRKLRAELVANGHLDRRHSADITSRHQ